LEQGGRIRKFCTSWGWCCGNRGSWRRPWYP
jgi:hypothetical protein